MPDSDCGGCAETINCDACAITNQYPITVPWREQGEGEEEEESNQMFLEGGFLQALETPLPCYAHSYVELENNFEEARDQQPANTFLGTFTMASIN